MNIELPSNFPEFIKFVLYTAKKSDIFMHVINLVIYSIIYAIILNQQNNFHNLFLHNQIKNKRTCGNYAMNVGQCRNGDTPTVHTQRASPNLDGSLGFGAHVSISLNLSVAN